MNRKEEANLAKNALALANSDHLTIYNAYMGYEMIMYNWEVQTKMIKINTFISNNYRSFLTLLVFRHSLTSMFMKNVLNCIVWCN